MEQSLVNESEQQENQYPRPPLFGGRNHTV